MGLLDDLKAPKRQWPCRVREIAEGLEPADAKILLEAVSNPDWPYYTLEFALKDKGISLSQSTIKRHRLKNCGCFR